MNWTGLELWTAIMTIAILTYLSRAAPLASRSMQRSLQRSALRRILPVTGATLLAALAGATIGPKMAEAMSSDRPWIFLLSTAVTVTTVLKWREAGLAVIAGMATFFLCLGLT